MNHDQPIYVTCWAVMLAVVALLVADAAAGLVATALTGWSRVASASKVPIMAASAIPLRGSALEGLFVDDLTPPIARQLGLPLRTKGVVVADVEPGSAAAESGLRRGDVIQEANHNPVSSVFEFENAVCQSGNTPLLLLVNRIGATIYIALQP